MPLAQDILTRIINVAWGGGGPFVAADNFAHVFYGMPRRKDPAKPPDPEAPKDFRDLGTLEFKFGSIFGGACGAVGSGPQFIFVLVGRWVNTDIEVADNQRPQGPMIMASKDGQRWTIAYRDTEFAGGRDDNFYQTNETFYGAVYDGGVGTFYAASYYNDFILDALGSPHVNEGERLYRSSDGFTWVKIGEQMRANGNTGMWDVDTPSLLAPHCTKPQNEGHAGTEQDLKIPDGLQGYNKGSDKFMKPFSLEYYSMFGLHYNSSIPANKVQITSHMHGSSPAVETRTVGMPCNCVANNGTIWVAGGGYQPEGHGQIDASFDGGNTWAKSFSPERDESEAEGGGQRAISVILAQTLPAVSP